LVLNYLGFLLDFGYSEATLNQRLSALKVVISTAADRGLLDLALARDLIKIPAYPKRPPKRGPTLSGAEAEKLINAPDESKPKGARDRALLALLVGCALRSGEAVKVQVEDIRRRGGHWVLTNVIGTRADTRTVVIPLWVKTAIDAWMDISRIQKGVLLRVVDRSGLITPRALSSNSVLPLVAEYGKQIGVGAKPSDLRRTCAHLCRVEGGGLEQIQLLLGHASIQTTEQYLGKKRVTASAPNARLRMKWHSQKVAS
jgi:integrase